MGNFSLPITEHNIIKKQCPMYSKVFYGHMPCVREWHLLKLVSYISALCSLCISADHCRQIQEDFYVLSHLVGRNCERSGSCIEDSGPKICNICSKMTSKGIPLALAVFGFQGESVPHTNSLSTLWEF